MSKFKSDIEIARKARMYPINKVLKKFKVPDKPFAFSPMGRHVAKINLEYIKKAGKTKKVKVSVIGKFTKEKKFLLDGKIFSGGYSHF